MRRPSHLSAALLAFASLASAAPIPRFTLELAGNAGLDIRSIDGRESTSLYLYPAVHFYPSPYLFLGPRIGTGFTWSSGSTFRWSEWGAEAALVLPIDNTPFNFYLGSGASVTGSRSDTDGIGDSEADSYRFSAFGGLKLQLVPSFCLNIQPTYDFDISDGPDVHNFGVQIGFSGLLMPRGGNP